jgi:hypothetical protein
MAHPQVRFVAVDAAFLISLAKGDPACETAVDLVVKRLRFFIVVPPASIQALYDVIDNEPNPEVRQYAANALQALTVWGFVIDGLNDLQLIYADGATRSLEERTQLPHLPSRMLSETSVLKCAMLISDDSRLCGVDNKKLEILLLDRGLDGFLIIDPESFAEAAISALGEM